MVSAGEMSHMRSAHSWDASGHHVLQGMLSLLQVSYQLTYESWDQILMIPSWIRPIAPITTKIRVTFQSFRRTLSQKRVLRCKEGDGQCILKSMYWNITDLLYRIIVRSQNYVQKVPLWAILLNSLRLCWRKTRGLWPKRLFHWKICLFSGGYLKWFGFDGLYPLSLLLPRPHNVDWLMLIFCSLSLHRSMQSDSASNETPTFEKMKRAYGYPQFIYKCFISIRLLKCPLFDEEKRRNGHLHNTNIRPTTKRNYC